MTENRTEFGFGNHKGSETRKIEEFLREYGHTTLIYVMNVYRDSVCGIFQGFDSSVRENYLVLNPSVTITPDEKMFIERKIPTKLLLPISVIRPLFPKDLAGYVKQYNAELERKKNTPQNH